jgi:carboxyl-terminal processing protease
MSKRFLLFGVGAAIVFLLVVGSFSIGMFVGGVFAEDESPVVSTVLESTVESVLATALPESAATPANTEELFEPFWQSWDLVHDIYIDQPVDDVRLMQGAIRGLMDSLGDQHSSYMDPDQYRQTNLPLQGGYEGIGAWVDTNGEYLTIVSPMPDSPAEEAGLIPGDQIIAVDGEDMTGIDGSLVIRKVVGPAGTPVTLTIFREGEPEPFDVTLNRAHIDIPAVESEMLEGDIALIRLSYFSQTATEEITDALKELLDQEPKGMILDLRNNPGGGRDTAVEIASQFVSEDVIMYQEYGDGSRDTFENTKGGKATDIELVVLVNEGSASGSEIVAGVIQDYNRGILVGTTTFGKGSVQSWVPLVDEQGAVRVTIARWLTPNGRTIHGLGIEPDYTIEITKEDIEAERDPQLEKAIELLTNP